MIGQVITLGLGSVGRLVTLGLGEGSAVVVPPVPVLAVDGVTRAAQVYTPSAVAAQAGSDCGE